MGYIHTKGGKSVRKKAGSWRMGFLFALCVGMLFGCQVAEPAGSVTKEGGSSEYAATSPAEQSKQEITVVLDGEATSLDPFNASDTNTIIILSSMFEGLLGFSEDGSIVPVLSTDYMLNEDATALTFHLRKDVEFHDGSKLTAEVVKENFDFVRNKDNGMARSSFFSFIDDIEIIDESTLRIISKSPNSAMISYMAHPSASIKSLPALQKKKDDPEYNLDRNPVGTGPYLYGEWQNGQYVKVIPFERYWNKEQQPKLAGIVFKPVAEASTRINMLQTKEADVVTSLPTMDAARLRESSEIDVFAGPSLNMFYVGINVSQDKYKDQRVRHAMNYALNKEQLINQVADGNGNVADSPLSPLVKGYTKQRVYEYDLDKAKSLMVEAGYPDGFEATLWTRNTTEFIAIAENVKIQLHNIGIRVKVEAFESGTLFEKLDSGEGTDLFIGRWGAGTAEADWGLRPNFASDRIPPNENNAGFYINPKVDELLNQALKTNDQAEGAKIYADVQKLIFEDAPWIFLYVPDTLVAKRSDVFDVSIINGLVRLNKAYKQ